jgi:hypothetical protein
MIAVLVPLDVEADHVIAFGKQAVRPAAQAAEQIDRQRPSWTPRERRGGGTGGIVTALLGA